MMQFATHLVECDWVLQRDKPKLDSKLPLNPSLPIANSGFDNGESTPVPKAGWEVKGLGNIAIQGAPWDL